MLSSQRDYSVGDKRIFTFQKIDVIIDKNLIFQLDVQYFESGFVEMLAEHLQRFFLEVVRAYKAFSVIHERRVLAQLTQLQVDVK